MNVGLRRPTSLSTKSDGHIENLLIPASGDAFPDASLDGASDAL